MAKLRFGYFIAPFHRAGTNPTLALQRDLEFIEHLDAVGFDEVWLGEHITPPAARSSALRKSSSRPPPNVPSGFGLYGGYFALVPQPALGR